MKKSAAVAVIEGDIDSMVDSEKIDAIGVKALQIRTGGFLSSGLGYSKEGA